MYAVLVCDNDDESALLSVVLERLAMSFRVARSLDRPLPVDASEIEIVLLGVRRPSPPDQVRLVRRQTDAPLAVIAHTLNEDALCEALEAGADWVTTRPYSSRLLLTQLRALLRRGRGAPTSAVPNLVLGDLTVDPAARTVQVGDRPARRLTQLEFRLLYTLMMHRGQVLPTPTLVERVWGYEGEGNMELVRGLVSRLRAKIEDEPKSPRHILTVPGVGYRIVNPEA
jgi:DNA-binding response OmpR family regulator